MFDKIQAYAFISFNGLYIVFIQYTDYLSYQHYEHNVFSAN